MDQNGSYTVGSGVFVSSHSVTVVPFGHCSGVNVPVSEEVELKLEARARGLLMMGPDCGTAIINGVPLGFANAVPGGDVGIEQREARQRGVGGDLHRGQHGIGRVQAAGAVGRVVGHGAGGESLGAAGVGDADGVGAGGGGGEGVDDVGVGGGAGDLITVQEPLIREGSDAGDGDGEDEAAAN
jgi:hypothetical protein